MKFIIILVLAISGFGGVAFASPGPIGTIEGMVVNIHDGGNIIVNADGSQLYVQLAGIDAPLMPRLGRSSGWVRKPGQPFSRESFIALANKILHKKIRLDILQVVPYKQGPYQQAIAVVWHNGHNINIEMVAEGWAWASPRPSPFHTDSLRSAQRYARVHRRGLWMQQSPEPPWVFRQRLAEEKPAP